MFKFRYLKKALLASLAVLPLTACTPETLNAVTNLLKDQSLRTRTETNQQTSRPDSEAAPVVNPAHAPRPMHLAEPRPAYEPASEAQPAPVYEKPAEPGMADPPPDKPLETAPETMPELAIAHSTEPGEHACALVRVRFGQFDYNPHAPLTYWKGALKTQYGQMKLFYTVHFEDQDYIQMMENNELVWNTATKPHYDGFVALIKPLPDQPLPKLILHTPFGEKVFSYQDLAHLNATKLVDQAGNKFQISSYWVQGGCADEAAIQEDPAYNYPDQDKQIIEDQSPEDGSGEMAGTEVSSEESSEEIKDESSTEPEAIADGTSNTITVSETGDSANS